MTERWRKRLGDLDKQSPNEDLFERAKGGPQLPDEPISRPSTSTRVVTAVAAFLVFALAISVFAIPALRLKGDSSALGPSSAQLPLWPVRTMDDVRLVQAKEDDTPSFLEDPNRVAQAFGANVMGWKDFQVDEIPASGTAYMAPSMGYACDAAGAFSCEPYAGIGNPPGSSGGPSSTATSPFRAFQLTRLVCGGDACAAWIEYVFEFQPDRQGAGGVWMVLRAQADGVTLSYQPGDVVSDGGSIDAFGSVWGAESILGYQAGEGTCQTSAATTEFSRTSTPGPGPSPGSGSSDLIYGASHSELAVTLPPIGGCSGAQPGYLYAASFERGTGASGPGDPIPGSAATVNQLTAVPVTFEWPAERTAETESSSSSSAPVSWTTYSDRLGWTIDVPSSWQSGSATPSNDKVSFEGVWFSDGEVAAGPSPGPTNFPGDPVATTGHAMVKIWHMDGGPGPSFEDDSSLPLSYQQIISQQKENGYPEAGFRADGLQFGISIRAGDDTPLTSEQAQIVTRMIASIAFQPWSKGEARNGWSSVGRVLPSATAEWLTIDGVHWYATNVDGQRWLIGPAPACDAGGSFEVRETGVAGVVCPNGTRGDWDFEGRPQQGNSQGFADKLKVHPAELAWDGSLLVAFDTEIGF